MSSYNAFYVRRQAADDAARAAILRLYPRARIEVTADFIGGVLSGDDLQPPERALAALSAELGTDVIWVGYQTTAEAFIFHRWRSGSPMRALWYGCADEGVWARVEGEPEPWEREAFGEDGEAPRPLKPGRSEPVVSAEDAAHAAMEHYGLFADGEATPAAEPSSRQPAPKVSPKLKYGCLLLLLFAVGVVVLAVVGLIRLFR